MQPPDIEIRELRRLIRDLVALATTPAGWVGRDLPRIADGVADILLHTLRADAVYISLHPPTPAEGVRAAAYPGFGAEVQRLLAERGSTALMVETVSLPAWPSPLNVAVHPVGLLAEDGFVAVGSPRPGFPTEAESLLLSVASNQAAVANQTARLRATAEFERQRLAELLAQAPAAIGMLSGPDHRWLYVNEHYVRVTGRNSTADFVGKTLRESLPELETQPFLDLLDEVYRSGQPYFGHEMKSKLSRAHTGQAEEAYFDFVYQPVRNADRAVDGILIHAVEVTEKVLARKKVEESERNYRDLAETASMGLHWVGPDGTILWANQAELAMLGYRPEEYLGHNITEFHVDAPVICDILERLANGQKLREYEARLRAKDGSIRHVVIDSSVLFEDGKFIHTRCFTRDVTERRQAEAALRASEERFRAIVETTPECVKLVAPDGMLLQMNSAGLEMIGADCAEMAVGRNIYDVIAPEDRERFREFNRLVCQGQRGALEFDIIGLKGVRRHMETHAAPLQSVDGSLLHLAVTRDVTERKVAEQALRESEQRLRVVTDATPVMIWMSGTDKLCYYLNKSWLEFVGRTLEQEVGNGWAENVHPDDFERCLEIYVTSFDARKPFEMEYRLRHHSGQYRWILDHGVPRYRPDGTFEGYVGGCLDIHDQKEAAERARVAAEALRQSEEEFRALANSMPQLAWMANPDGWIFWYNQGWYQYTGTTPEQMEGWGWQSVHDPAVLPSVLDRWKWSIESGEPFEMRFPIRGVDGKFRSFLTRVIPIRDASGNIKRWFGTNTDITAEVEIQEQLQRALLGSQRLAAIVESSEDAIIGKDLNGIVTTWNPAAERIFGYTAQEIIGRSIRTIIPLELQEDEERILATIARGERIEHLETVRLRKDGERIHVSLTVSPVKDASGRIIGIAKITRDITNRKRAEEALRRAEKMAATGQLAASIAHEINNPLQALSNLLALISYRATLDENSRQLVALAQTELGRMSHIARQMLSFYRESPAPIPIKLTELLEDVLELFVARAHSNHIRIEREYESGGEVHGYPVELRQLFTNLVANAIEAMGEKGRLRIRVASAREPGAARRRGVRVTIADSGPGIPTELRDRIFEAFFTTKTTKGTGLGLWVVQGIVTQHGGTLRLRSRTGLGRTGTVFSVFLPAEAAWSALSATAATESAA